jgi:organic radical activating enzyme
MNDLDFRQQVLDTLSPSFCGAKWFNATIWLGSGMSTSCHHPPAHLVDIDKVTTNPKLLHNTPQKKDDRARMIAGERPAGCEYCWKIEDMGRSAVSDRVYKSKIYPIAALKEAHETPPDQDVDLRTLEISFDRTCQLACSYCNPAFSSTWVKDIRNNGPYMGLVSDGRNHFTHEHSSAQLYRFGETNPYVEAFFAWWESDLHHTLQELRITGGEPLMSAHTWRLIDWFRDHRGRSATRLAVNSNLGPNVDVDRLLDSIQGLDVDIYTSQEAVGVQAEYIRDGLDYTAWQANVEKILASGRVRTLHFMGTINALCLPSLTDHLRYLLKLKQRYGRDAVSYTLNILRFPSFQSALVMPHQLRAGFAAELKELHYRNQRNPLFHEHELDHVQRLIDYLDVVETPHSEAFDLPKLLNDFVEFYQQYDQRRGKDFATAFPKLNQWYQSL